MDCLDYVNRCARLVLCICVVVDANLMVLRHIFHIFSHYAAAGYLQRTRVLCGMTNLYKYTYIDVSQATGEKAKQRRQRKNADDVSQVRCGDRYIYFGCVGSIN